MIVLPTKQQTITENVIRATILGQNDSQSLVSVQINELRRMGAANIILGCTELSVVMNGFRSKLFIDPLELAVDAIFSEKIRL